MADIESAPVPAAADADALLAAAGQARDQAALDPFGNPVLSLALGISRRIDDGALPDEGLQALVRVLRDAAFADRAGRLAAYVGGTDASGSVAAMAAMAQRLVRPDPSDSPVPLRAFRAALERTRFAAVFTAHPTFAHPPEVFAALAEAACGRPAPSFASHRPRPPTLAEEFAQAAAAIGRGRDALDALNGAFFDAARPVWPDRWTELVPRPLVLASWVGYDTDGRTDIDWFDTLRLRLEMKRLQLARLGGQVAGTVVAGPVEAALAAVGRQIAACPDRADADQTARFAHVLVGEAAVSLTSPAPLLAPFADAIARPMRPGSGGSRSRARGWSRTGFRSRTRMSDLMRRRSTTRCARNSAFKIRTRTSRAAAGCSAP